MPHQIEIHFPMTSDKDDIGKLLHLSAAQQDVLWSAVDQIVRNIQTHMSWTAKDLNPKAPQSLAEEDG